MPFHTEFLGFFMGLYFHVSRRSRVFRWGIELLKRMRLGKQTLRLSRSMCLQVFNVILRMSFFHPHQYVRPPECGTLHDSLPDPRVGEGGISKTRGSSRDGSGSVGNLTGKDLDRVRRLANGTGRIGSP